MPGDDQKQTATRRGLAAAVAVVFVTIFFAVPLYAAMTLCSMPCCAHKGGTEPAMSAGATACEQTCAVRADEAAPAPETLLTPEPRVSIALHVSAPAPEPYAAVPPRDDEPKVHRQRTAVAPLHLLHSIFRI